MNPKHIAMLMSLLLTAAAAAQSTGARKLRHDPFDWSALQQIVEKKSDTRLAAPDGAASASSAPAAPAPLLRAVMRGASGSHANLDGAILGIGESAHGYRLLEVREYSAVFTRDGNKIEIELGRRPPQ